MGSGGKGKGSTADGMLLPPNKYLPVKDAAFLAAFLRRECPVFVFGVGSGSMLLKVTFLFRFIDAIALAVLVSCAALCCSIVISGMHGSTLMMSCAFWNLSLSS